MTDIITPQIRCFVANERCSVQATSVRIRKLNSVHFVTIRVYIILKSRLMLVYMGLNLHYREFYQIYLRTPVYLTSERVE
jgi:hypothetical protein